MTSPTSFRYVPALDGVRALSVVAILLFHSPLLWAKGGFLGVSVFFTLSGFLITSLLLSERERTGRISLRGFWVRRARRLAPAILVLFALVAGLLATGNLAQRSSTFGDAVATAGWSANWRFVLSGQSYGEMFSEPTPFQHMWSLAVEEQFYLLFPGLLLLLLGRKRVRRWPAVLAVTLGIAASTALLWQLFTPGDTERAYYGTDTRMAEPFVGVLLALLLTRHGGVRSLPRPVRWLLDLAALGALGTLGYLVHTWGQYDHRLYQGGLLSVALLTAVVLAGVSQPGSLLGRLLGLAPLAWLGRISYGVYVYHWPVFLWLTPHRTGLEGYELLALRSALVISLAGASYYLIEQPIRQAKRFHISIALPAWANATVAAMAVLVLATHTISSTPRDASDRVSASAPVAPVTTKGKPAPTKATGKAKPSAAARKVTRGVQGVNPAQQPTRNPTRATQRPVTQSPTQTPTTTPTKAPPKLRIAIVGDSLADNLGKGLKAWASSTTTVVAKNFSLSGCPIALGGMRRWPDGFESRVRDECSWFVDKGSTRWKEFAAFNPDVIVMQDGMNELVERKLDTWSDYHVAGEPIFDEWLLEQYRDAFDIFNPTGSRTLLHMNAVCADWDRVNHFNGFQLELDRRVAALNTDYEQLAAVGMERINFHAHLCPNGQYTDEVDGVEEGRYDGYHLTPEAELALARRWLGPLCIDASRN